MLCLRALMDVNRLPFISVGDTGTAVMLMSDCARIGTDLADDTGVEK